MALEHRLHARCGCASIGSAEHAAAGARPFALPTSTRHFERDRPFAVDHLALDVTLDLAARSLRARATLDVRRVDASADELALDAVGFDVREVTVDGKRASWRYDGRTLSVALDGGVEKASVLVAYHATPRRGLYFLAARRARTRRARARCGPSARKRTRATGSPATTSRTSR